MERQNPSVREYWDRYLEHNPLRVHGGDTSAGALVSWILEAAGDILRELDIYPPGYDYIYEKYNRILNNLDDRSWYDPLSFREKEDIKTTKRLLDGLPSSGDARTFRLKMLMGYILDRKPDLIKKTLVYVGRSLSQIEDFKRFAENWPWK